MSSEIIHKNIKVSGRVQGVGFRYSTKLAAENIGVKGHVENLYDGSVYIEAEGSPEQVKQFIDWCNNGSRYAVVENIYIGDDTVKNFRTFDIKH